TAIAEGVSRKCVCPGRAPRLRYSMRFPSRRTFSGRSLPMSIVSAVRAPAAESALEALHEGTLLIPAPLAQQVELRFAPLAARDRCAPARWGRVALRPSFDLAGHSLIDLDALGLADGAYEYEFLLDGHADNPVPDPFAEEITRYGGYRGVFQVRDGRRVRPG